jgi:hypothetical protein
LVLAISILEIYVKYFSTMKVCYKASYILYLYESIIVSTFKVMIFPPLSLLTIDQRNYETHFMAILLYGLKTPMMFTVANSVLIGVHLGNKFIT